MARSNFWLTRQFYSDGAVLNHSKKSIGVKIELNLIFGIWQIPIFDSPRNFIVTERNQAAAIIECLISLFI